MYLFDLHCDTMTRLYQGERLAPGNYSLRSNGAHLALERMRNFHWVQCFAIFIPDILRGKDAQTYFERCYAFFGDQLEQNQDWIGQARSSAQWDALLEQKKAAAVLTVEGGAVLGGELSMVERLVECGVRALTLTWNGPNELGSGNGTQEGLTPFGVQAVKRLEQLGIAVDVSHLNDRGFWELMEVVKRPFLATHSNARAICPHPRNLTDQQIQALVEREGLIGLNYCVPFLKEDGQPVFADVAEHIRHFLELGAEDYLALGSDYDGADIPDWLDGGERQADFFQLVQERFGKVFAQKLFFENAQAFWKRYEAAGQTC